MNDLPLLKVIGDDGSRHRPRPLVASEDWRLRVHGAVERPVELDLAALRALGTTVQSQTITCVSAANIVPGGGEVGFEGIPFAALAEHVRPRTAAHAADQLAPTVRFVSKAPGTVGPRSAPHWTSLPLADCLDPRHGLLLATHLQGAPLPYPNGGPLRSVVGPELFFYKAIKWLVEIEFVDRPQAACRGTWEEYAGYHNRARTALGERCEPMLRRILEVRDTDDGPEDVTEAIPETSWARTLEDASSAGDWSRLMGAKVHKIQPRGVFPKDFTGYRFVAPPFRAKLRDTSFAGADLRGVDLRGCGFSLSKFTNTRFSDGRRIARLDGCDFESAYLNNAHLQEVSMRGAWLVNATFFAERDVDRPTDRVRGLDLREAHDLDPRTAEWLHRNGAIVP